MLERAGLLTKRRQGREALASGDVQAVRSVGAMLTELEGLWRGRIARMDDLFAQDTRTLAQHPTAGPTAETTAEPTDVPTGEED